MCTTLSTIWYFLENAITENVCLSRHVNVLKYTTRAAVFMNNRTTSVVYWLVYSPGLVSVLALTGQCARLDCGRSWVQTPELVKLKSIKLVFVGFPLSTHHYDERANTGWLGIRLMFPRGATCLSSDYCFSEKMQRCVLVQYKADIIIISLKINLFST